MAVSTMQKRPGSNAAGGGKHAKSVNGGAKMQGQAMKKKKKSRHPKPHLEPAVAAKLDEDLIRDADDMMDDEGSDGEGSGAVAASRKFLLGLDEKQISRTRAETERLHRKEIAQQAAARRKVENGKGKQRAEEDSDAGSTDMEGASIASDDDAERPNDGEDVGLGSDEEAAYMARMQRIQRRAVLQDDEEHQNRKRKRLPTRGEGGWSSGEDDGEQEGGQNLDEDKAKGNRAVHAPLDEGSEDDEDVVKAKAYVRTAESTITTGARFGLRSPYEIFTQKKRGDRVRLAREQIARLSTDIVNDPEVSLGLIKRLATFANQNVTSAEDREKSAPVDEAARASAILSLCAVFVDILPGYRIRALSEAEQQERVNQELARRREWEQGLVNVYRNYLELCERVSRKESALFSVSLKAMCILAVKATHFNYRTNLIRSLVSCLSRKEWDSASDEASHALITVLKEDKQGDVSLEVVRLVNRMVKERHFRVDARVLDILRHLRLRDELPQGKRATMTTATDATKEMNDVYNKKLKSKDIRKGKGEHLSKKEAKRRKEMREIVEEMKEAEAEVDHEERERHQTETLKLLFVLYFSIVKAERISDALLIATLKGLSLFALRINIDFFRDLLAVLRQHIKRSMIAFERSSQSSFDDDEENEDSGADRPTPLISLQCIVTAFELLDGQGEALNVDVGDIVASLYTIMIPLCTDPSFEEQSTKALSTPSRAQDDPSAAQLLLRALHLSLVMPPVHSLSRERLASFAARMCVCALHTPPKTSLALVETVHQLVRRHPALQGLLENGEDRARNGHFDATSDHVEGLRPLQAGCIIWPLTILRDSCHDDVRSRVDALIQES